jgi:hypothetical protein
MHRISRARIAATGCLALALVLLTGCLYYRGERVPRVPPTAQQASYLAAAAPRLELVLNHSSTIDGMPSGSGRSDRYYPAVWGALDRMRTGFPFLLNAGFKFPDPEYVLELDTLVDDSGGESAKISGLTLFLVPGFGATRFRVQARLKQLDGTVIAEREASVTTNVVYQLFLLPLVPINRYASQDRTFYDDTLRDVLIPISDDIASLPAATPAAGS